MGDREGQESREGLVHIRRGDGSGKGPPRGQFRYPRRRSGLRGEVSGGHRQGQWSRRNPRPRRIHLEAAHGPRRRRAEKGAQSPYNSTRERIPLRLQQEHGEPHVFLHDGVCGRPQGGGPRPERQLQRPGPHAPPGDERPGRAGHCAPDRHPCRQHHPGGRQERLRPFRQVPLEGLRRGPRPPEAARLDDASETGRAGQGEGRGPLRDSQKGRRAPPVHLCLNEPGAVRGTPVRP